MGLFSFLNKNKQESTEDGDYVARDDENALVRSKRPSSAGEPAARRTRESKSAADPVLPEKKRARRRLVGAIALAMAVAIGLPMILDSEPKPLATDIDIRIPSKDKVAPQPMPRAVAAADTLDAREEIVEASPVAAEPASRAVAEVKRDPVKPEPKPEPKAAVKPEPKKPEPKVEPKPAEKPAAKPVKPEEKHPKAEVAKPEAERAIAILEGKAPEAAPKPAVDHQKYVVQVAALASQDKVDELQERLRAGGISSFTRKVPTASGERIRIQVGPFSKEEAEKVRAKLAKMGLSGIMVGG